MGSNTLMDDPVLERPGDIVRDTEALLARAAAPTRARRLRIIDIAGAEDPMQRRVTDALVDGGHLAIAAIEGERLLYASPALCSLLKLRAVEVHAGVALSVLLHEEDAPRAIGALVDAQARNAPIGLECRLSQTLGGTGVRLSGCPSGSQGERGYALLWIAAHSHEAQEGSEPGRAGIEARKPRALPGSPGPAQVDRSEALAPEPAPTARSRMQLPARLLDRAATMLRDSWLRNESIAVLAFGVAPAGEERLDETGQHQLESAVFDRLRSCLRGTDAFGRREDGGLLAVVGGVQNSFAAALVAGRLIENMREPFAIGPRSVGAAVNVGIAVYPFDDPQLGGLLEHAEYALETARQSGGNRYSLAETSLNRSIGAEPIVWHDGLRLGSPEIDEQHYRMITMLAEIQRELQSQAAIPRLLARFETLMRMLNADFVAEERILGRKSSPTADAHRKDHRRILHNLGYLRNADPVQATALGLRLIADWVGEHIVEHDAKLLGPGAGHGLL